MPRDRKIVDFHRSIMKSLLDTSQIETIAGIDNLPMSVLNLLTYKDVIEVSFKNMEAVYLYHKWLSGKPTSS